jgi:hypothetical protein
MTPGPPLEERGDTLAYIDLKLQIVKTDKNCTTINVIISGCNITFFFTVAYV